MLCVNRTTGTGTSRWAAAGVALGIAAAAALVLAVVGPREAGHPAAAPAVEPDTPVRPAPAPDRLAAGCGSCHGAIAAAYRDHGMFRTVGRAHGVTTGTVTNPASKVRYDLTVTGDAAWLTATAPDGGIRRQRIVGRVGAGIFDTSWIATEVDTASGVATGRLFFAPVETVTGKGLQLSPFELHPRSAGLDMPATRDCFTCHTLDRVDGGTPRFPAHQLGADLFDSIGPLGCSACHGDAREHAAMMSGSQALGTRQAAVAGGLGVARLGRLTPGQQRDVCARCHLQGDARIDLVNGAPDRARPLAGQIPVLVPAAAQAGFRFVGQLERLALSACFRSSPAMTCTTCHNPHAGVRAQGVESFDRACIACHNPPPAHTGTHEGRSTPLTPAQVTGDAARSAAGCVDCHVRRSQPFDLPHVRTADHFIRRRIERPQHDVPHRQFAAREGALVLYDDGRLRAALGTAAGRRWADGVTAMGLLTMGRFAEAARLLASFPPPGSAAAREASAPEGFAPLETSAAFHTVRGYVLMAGGRMEEAARALSDAIAIDPNAADARMARARLSLDRGDVRGAGIDTEAVIRAFPQAEQPWDLRIEIAQRTGRPDLALSAADASTRLWPSNPRTWTIVAALAAGRGQSDRARQALERARTLSPSVVSNSRQPAVGNRP